MHGQQVISDFTVKPMGFLESSTGFSNLEVTRRAQCSCSAAEKSKRLPFESRNTQKNEQGDSVFSSTGRRPEELIFMAWFPPCVR